MRRPVERLPATIRIAYQLQDAKGDLLKIKKDFVLGPEVRQSDFADELDAEDLRPADPDAYRTASSGARSLEGQPRGRRRA